MEYSVKPKSRSRLGEMLPESYDRLFQTSTGRLARKFIRKINIQKIPPPWYYRLVQANIKDGGPNKALVETKHGSAESEDRCICQGGRSLAVLFKTQK